MTTLIFVRHGESEGNVLMVYCGHRDYDLSEIGYRQAALTADFLKENYQIDKIYSSDLKRAYHTAEPTAKAFGLEITTSPALREMSAGVWEGKSADFLQQKYPEAFDLWRRGKGPAPEGGETHDQVRQRATAYLAQILKENAGKTIAVFGHWGSLYWCIRESLFGSSLEGREKMNHIVLENASVKVLSYDEQTGRFALLCADGTEHLGDLIAGTVEEASAGEKQ